MLEQVVQARGLMAEAAEDWKRLDAETYALIRPEYATDSSGSGELPVFPGLDGPLRAAAVPRELRALSADPTIRSRAA